MRILAAALLLLSASARAAEPADGALLVRIYHTNDVHGWIMARPDKLNADRSLGGAAALKALIDKEAGPKLVLDAGDWWQGTPEGSLTKGEASAEAFNAIGYDAVEVGNHEFDAGAESLQALIQKLKMPVLAANIYGSDGRHVPWTKQRIVKEVAGVKFGIFGLLSSHMTKLELPKHIEGLTFRRESDEAREQVAALKKEGADVIIAVTHVGYEAPDKPKFEGDQTLAREVPGIDLIVGGHTHTALSRPWRDPVNGTLVVQAGSYLTKAGRTTLRIDPKSRRVVSSSDELIELWPDRIGENPAVKEIVARRAAEVGEIFKTVVATAAADLNRAGDNRESVVGSWVADCFRDWAGVDVVIMNTGGIRSDLPAGPVTLRRLFEVSPFDNMIVKLKMKGADVRAALDRVVGSYRGAQISGMTAETAPLRKPRERLSAVTAGGAPLDDEKIYTVATVDFVVGSYEEFDRALSVEPTGALGRDALRACAEKQKTITPPTLGRMKAVEN